MNSTWTRICQANLDHYNNHPTSHKAAIAVYAVVAVVGVNAVVKRLARQDTGVLRSGHMA